MTGCRPADYTPVDRHDGATYMTVVECVPQAEVERQSREVLGQTAGNPPATDAKWSRVKILKINPDGTEQEALLGGQWFIFDARDAKMDGWAVGVDKQGYVHLVGGQHNSPQAKNYVPGSWAKMGITEKPKIMYWVSKEPGNIASMEFVGAIKDPRRVPCGWMNYMNFTRNPAGDLFLYGRDHIWTWGLDRYDVETRRWTNLGGSPTTMLQTAKKTMRHGARVSRTQRPGTDPPRTGSWSMRGSLALRSNLGPAIYLRSFMSTLLATFGRR